MNSSDVSEVASGLDLHHKDARIISSPDPILTLVITLHPGRLYETKNYQYR